MSGNRPTTPRAGTGRPYGLALFPAIIVLSAVLLGWGDAAHRTITDTAFGRLLSPPLSTWYADHKTEVLNASLGPDHRVAALRNEIDRLTVSLDQIKDRPAAEKQLDELRQQAAAERSKHFFDLDALTDAKPPFADFPHDEAAARKAVGEFLLRSDRAQAAKLLGLQADKLPKALPDADLDRLGQAAMNQLGTLPWAIRDQMALLTETFRKRELDRLPEVIGDLAHYLADLYQPLHTTKHYDGTSARHAGIHKALEIDIINRYREHYGTLPPDYLTPYDRENYPLKVMDLVFRRLAENVALVEPIMAAEAEARRASGVTAEDLAWLKALDREERDVLIKTADLLTLDDRRRRVVAYVDALQKNVTGGTLSDGPRRWMGQAASSLAALVYTAWLDADRPPLAPLAAKPETPRSPIADWLLYLPGVVLLGLFLAMILGRRPKPPDESNLD